MPRKYSMKKSKKSLKKKKSRVRKIKGKGSFLKKYYNLYSLKNTITHSNGLYKNNLENCSLLTFEDCNQKRNKNGIRTCKYNFKDQICNSI